MPIDDRSVLWASAAFYVIGFLLGTISVVRERRHSHGLMFATVLIGYLFQCLGLFLRGQAVQGCPLGNSFEILQFSAWSATSLYLLIGTVFRLSMLGYFTTCLAAVLTGLSLAIPSLDATRSNALSGGNPFVAMHAGVAMFAYGVFAMLALCSLLLLIRHYSIKNRRLGGWFSFLPPLVQLDQISIRLLGTGVVLMTLAMGVGYMYWRLDDAVVNRSKLMAVGLLWVAYLVVFLLRMSGTLVGRRFAWCCALLYVAALLSLVPIDRSRHAPASVTPNSSHHTP